MRQTDDGGGRIMSAGRIAIVAALAASVTFAIDGTVQNATSGRPQAGATVTLMELSSGMNSLGSVKTDAEGRFRFDAARKPDVPYLVQAMHQGVTYNRMLQPGPDQPISMEVYDAAAKAPQAKVTQHMILIEPSGKDFSINESVIYSNDGKITYFDPNGTLRIWVPSEMNGPVRLRITAPQGMPVNREAEKGPRPNERVVHYPIKPGETRIDLQYTVAAADPSKYSGRILHGGGPVRIIAPRGVKLVSEALSDLGPEPRTQATVYQLNGTEYNLAVEGTGQLRDQNASAESGGSAEGASEGDTPGIDMAKPRIYTRLPWVLGFGGAMLAVGFVMLYRTR
ncbi:MAG TPA: carboxypeptidase-like regulatory domain-containing protein [Bryobacteraceae bacterium]|nr:carboxypeptidase-like regulatory domain-containing protein [Bryobacteraceae bacterium]